MPFSGKQVDPALKQAELFGQITVELRRQTGDAVRLLEKLVQLSYSIQLPSFECFMPDLENLQERTIEELRILPKPNFLRRTIEIDHAWFLLKTSYDLMVANFAAKHFKKAKLLCQHVS